MIWHRQKKSDARGITLCFKIPIIGAQVAPLRCLILRYGQKHFHDTIPVARKSMYNFTDEGVQFQRPRCSVSCAVFKKYLYAFLEDPSIPVDNNTAERAVKPFVIVRKNWLFSASPKGAEASAVAYSVIQTALVNNLNARDYLTQVFAGKGITKLPFETE